MNLSIYSPCGKAVGHDANFVRRIRHPDLMSRLDADVIIARRILADPVELRRNTGNEAPGAESRTTHPGPVLHSGSGVKAREPRSITQSDVITPLLAVVLIS